MLAAMTVGELSSSAQDYLKVVWTAQEWNDEPVTTSWIAERLGVRPSTASVMIKKLAEQGLLEHAKYGHVELTAAGRGHAVAMVRRHRLLETFLVEVLGYSWDEVHDEAEVLEHAVSTTLVERMDAYLDHPVRDPHGDPIPSPSGEPHRPDATPLGEAPEGERLTVARISDADPDMLRFFAERGIGLDAGLTVVRHEPYAEALVVQVDGAAEPVLLGEGATAAVWVTA